jgi:CSLREA domain-containing protein
MKSLRIFLNLGIIVVFLVISTGMRPWSPEAPTVIINVSTTADENGSNLTACSLREAVTSANNSSAFGGCDYSGSGDVVIELYTNTFYLSVGHIYVGSIITINGDGREATIIDGNNLQRIFYLGGTSSLTLNDMTLTHGKAPDGDDGAAGSNGGDDEDGQDGETGESGDSGGAVYTMDDPLIFNRVNFINNASGNAGNGGRGGNGGIRVTAGIPTNGGKGGYGGYGGLGGGVFSSSGSVTINACIFSGNHTGNGGNGGNGGDAGKTVAFSPTNPGNSGTGGAGYYGARAGDGGAVYLGDGSLTITNSEFYNNYTGNGGMSGLGGDGADGKTGTLVSNYIAGSGGSGGLSESAGYGGDGGAVKSRGSTVITNSSFHNNATGHGGDGQAGGLGGHGGTGGDNPGASIPGCCRGGSGGNGGRSGIAGRGGHGGAVYSWESLTISNSTFFENTTGAGGIGSDGASGGAGGAGGKSVDSAPGGNGGNGGNGGSASGYGNGGAINAYSGSITITGSAIYNNSVVAGGHSGSGGAGGAGGAGGPGTSGTLGGTGGIGGTGGNSGAFTYSGYGGGVSTNAGLGDTISIINTTISGNTSGETVHGTDGGTGGAGGNGGSSSTPSANGGPGGAGGNGGYSTGGCPGGGGAFDNNNDSTTNVVFSTIANNTTPASTGVPGTRGYGGAGGIGSNGTHAADGTNGYAGTGPSVSRGGGLFRVDGTVNLQNTLVASNSADVSPDCNGSFVSLDYNLVGVTGACSIAYQGHDRYDGSASPLNLDVLADNGGNTMTHALLLGSVAMDQIPDEVNGCGTTYITDQRNSFRPLDGDGNDTVLCDIGAFETGSLVLDILFWLPLIERP